MTSCQREVKHVNKKENSSPDVFDTLIGVNTFLEGNIETEGTVRIDGKIKGTLK